MAAAAAFGTVTRIWDDDKTTVLSFTSVPLAAAVPAPNWTVESDPKFLPVIVRIPPPAELPLTKLSRVTTGSVETAVVALAAAERPKMLTPAATAATAT